MYMVEAGWLCSVDRLRLRITTNQRQRSEPMICGNGPMLKRIRGRRWSSKAQGQSLGKVSRIRFLREETHLLVPFSLGHSQFTVNSFGHILIVGGSSSTRVCRDVWLYSLETHQWTEIVVHNQYPHDFSPNSDDVPHLPFCFVASSRILVTFARIKRQPTEKERDAYSRYDFSHCDDPSRHPWSTLVRVPLPSSSSDESDETARASSTMKRTTLPVKQNKYHIMDLASGFQMYRMDLSNLFASDASVTWLPSKSTSVFGSPSRSCLCYSLICARSELVLFGGTERRKIQQGRILPDRDKSLPSRSQSMEGTLAFVTLSNLSL